MQNDSHSDLAEIKSAIVRMGSSFDDVKNEINNLKIEFNNLKIEVVKLNSKVDASEKVIEGKIESINEKMDDKIPNITAISDTANAANSRSKWSLSLTLTLLVSVVAPATLYFFMKVVERFELI